MANADINIRYSLFTGLDTINDPTKLKSNESAIGLTKALNVDITDSYSVKRRSGFSLFSVGNYSSIWGNGKNCYAVDDNKLIELFEDGTKNVLRYITTNYQMSFADSRDGYVYCTNGVDILKIRDGVVYELGSSSDKFKHTLPPGNLLSFLSPRLLVVRSNVIFISDAVNKDVFHTQTGFIQFDSDIRMIAPVNNNMYVSDSRFTWFLKRMNNTVDIQSPMFQLTKVLSYPSFKNNPVKFINDFSYDNNKFSEVVMWLSSDGICFGTDEGIVFNITNKKYTLLNHNTDACVEYINNKEQHKFISVIKGV